MVEYFFLAVTDARHISCSVFGRRNVQAIVTLQERCLRKNESCPDGYYYEWVGPQEQGELKPLAGKAVCRKCHPRCRICSGYGFHEQVCQECMQYKRGEQCEDECPQDHYADEATQECVQCHYECRGCHGPGPSNSDACRNYKIYAVGKVMSYDKYSGYALIPCGDLKW